MKSCIIYEGVFDPPHIGHFWTLQDVKERFSADAIVVPATNKAARTLSNKPNVSPHHSRIDWCRTAFSEIAAVYTTRKIYTVDVIRSVLKTCSHLSYKEWIYLIGPDRSISEYKNHKKILDMVHVHKAKSRFNIRSSEIRTRMIVGKTVTGLLGPGLTEEL